MRLNKHASIGSIIVFLLLAGLIGFTIWYFAGAAEVAGPPGTEDREYMEHDEGVFVVLEDDYFALKPNNEESVFLQIKNMESPRCTSIFYPTEARCLRNDRESDQVVVDVRIPKQIRGGGSIGVGNLTVSVGQDAYGGKYKCNLIISKEESECSTAIDVVGEIPFELKVKRWVNPKSTERSE